MRSPERSARTLVGAVFALALLLRLLYLTELSETPWWRALVVDEEAYDRRGVAVAEGDLRLGSRPFYQDPLYPYFLGAVYRVAGHDYATVRIIQAVLGAAGAAAAAAAGIELAGPVAGGLAGLLMALCPSLLFYDGQIEKTGPTVALTAVMLLAAVRAARRGARAHDWLGAGLTWGLLALLRGNFLLLLPLALGWAWLASGRRSRATVAFLAGIVVALLPATARNVLVAGELVLVTSQGGQNLYLGNWAGNRTGMYVPPPFVRPHPDFEEADFAREAERRLGHPLPARAVSRFWVREALADLAADPGRAGRFVLRRLALALHPEDVPDNLDLSFVGRTVPLLRAPLPDFGLLVPLGVTGAVVLLSRRDAAARLVPLFALAYLATLLPFFLFGRYRAPLAPALALCSGALVAWALEATGRKRFAALAVAALVVVALVAGGRALEPVDHQEAQSWNTLGAMWEKLGEPERALAAYEAGARVEPDHALLSYNRARQQGRAGNHEEAERLYRAAIAALPSFAEARANLGALRLERGDLAGARVELEQALALDPTLAQASYNLAAVAEREGSLVEAAERYREAARRLPPGSTLAAEALRRAAALAPR